MQTGSLLAACVGLVFASAYFLGAASPGPEVAVTGGRVAGRALNAGAVFMGIPFAQPPVGDLRWREPMPVKAWTGVREATQYGAPCAQVAAGWNDKVAAAGSEDCLFLNVWAPEWPSRSRKPVMFWIHGGANMGGSAMGAAGIEPPFDGEKLAQRGVVVVTINYRLGMFGFFVHPELTAESPHSAAGNYGILDQIAVLKWVKDNIAKFGGDPGNVTIFGQSAGAHDVGLLMTSPLAKGLFVHAIGESGSVIIRGELTPTRASKEQAGVKLAEAMKAPATGALKYLRGLPAAEVLKASPSYGGGGALRPEPDIDGWAITRPPAEVFRAGEEAPVPLIIGNNGRERSVAGGAEGLKKATEDFYGSAAPQAMKLYGEMGTTYPPHGDAGSHFATDTTFRCSAVTVVGWHSAKYPTYEFEFSRGYEPRGAVHSWELQYVFGMLSPQASEDGDRKLSAQMQEYWTNFSKTGNPNGGGLPVWPKADSSKRGYLDFSAEGPVAKTSLRGNACDLFADKVKAQMGH
ncbi:MAG: carboxylesterase family protein [Candidatus Solibacter sp.]|nr:carboxylesterase family protein [Candidatus Solibacter sp.]